MLTPIIVIVVAILLIGMIFSSMGKTVERIGKETKEAEGKPQTFLDQVRNFLNLIQLLAILAFYCVAGYLGFLVIKWIFF